MSMNVMHQKKEKWEGSYIHYILLTVHDCINFASYVHFDFSTHKIYSQHICIGTVCTYL